MNGASPMKLKQGYWSINKKIEFILNREVDMCTGFV
jgi:hypothetical protein